MLRVNLLRGRIRFSRGGTVTAVLVLLPVIALLGLWLAGLHVNLTASLPYGFYRQTAQPVQRDVLVLACLPRGEVATMAGQRHYLSIGRCPNRLSPLLKPVVAVAGDEVTFSDAGVWVNGHLLPNSAPRPTDPSGHPLPRPRQAHERLQKGQILLVSSYNPGSFDGRYFGVLEGSTVLSVVQPVLTWHRRDRP